MSSKDSTETERTGQKPSKCSTKKPAKDLVETVNKAQNMTAFKDDRESKSKSRATCMKKGGNVMTTPPERVARLAVDPYNPRRYNTCMRQ